MPRKGQKQSQATRERISRGAKRALSRRQRAARIAPGEILELRRSGTLSPSLQPFAALAIEEGLNLLQALGGDEANVSEQRLIMLQDVARVGILLRALMGRLLQTNDLADLDGDTVSKVCSLINARRANLVAIGLERRQHDLSLEAYLAKHEAENSAQATIDTKSEPVLQPTGASTTAPTASSATEREGPGTADKGE